MNPIFRSKRGFSPAGICVAVLCLLLTVGCVISPRRTLGGGGGTPTPTPSPTPTPNPAATGKLYVVNSTTSSLFRFDNAFTAIGSPTPAATIAGASTTLNSPNYMALDPAADRLYVADTSDLSVVIFDKISTQNGTVNLIPTRIIAGNNTMLVSGPADLFFDRVGNELYVLDDPNILVFNTASLSTGVNNVAPARTLTTTSFAAGAAAIFVDVANDRLFAADLDGAIAIYDNASSLPTGVITPSRSIAGSNTQLANPAGIQLDGQGRLVVSNVGTVSVSPSITIYPSSAITAGGNVAPVARISGSNTGFLTPMQIVVDPSGTGTVYLADANAAKVAVYTNLNTATGNINTAPNRSISGAGTGLTAGGPAGVALDNTR